MKTEIEKLEDNIKDLIEKNGPMSVDVIYKPTAGQATKEELAKEINSMLDAPTIEDKEIF